MRWSLSWLLAIFSALVLLQSEGATQSQAEFLQVLLSENHARDWTEWSDPILTQFETHCQRWPSQMVVRGHLRVHFSEHARPFSFQSLPHSNTEVAGVVQITNLTKLSTHVMKHEIDRLRLEKTEATKTRTQHAVSFASRSRANQFA